MEETKQIVSDFVQHAQSQMPTAGVESLIPDGITKIIMSLTGNYYDNWGVFEWDITDQPLLEPMKSAPCGIGFRSIEFEMGRMKWAIIAYPNGDRPENEGLFRVLLQPLSFDSNWSEILFFRKMEILQCGHCCSLVSSKKMGESSEATPVLITDFQDYKRLTIRVEVKMLKIVLNKKPRSFFRKSHNKVHVAPQLWTTTTSATTTKSAENVYPQNTSFTYRIDEQLMSLFKDQTRRGFTHSNNVQDDKWVMYYFPRWNEYITLYLRLVRFPRNCSGLRVNYKFRCEETGDEFVRENVIMTPDHKTQGAINWFEADRLDKTATFHVEVEIIEEVGSGTKETNEIVDDEELTAALFGKKEMKFQPKGTEKRDGKMVNAKYAKWANLTAKLKRRMSKMYGQ